MNQTNILLFIEPPVNLELLTNTINATYLHGDDIIGSNFFFAPVIEIHELVVTNKAIGWPPEAAPLPHPEWLHHCIDCTLLFFALVMCLSAASIAFSAWKDRKRT